MRRITRSRVVRLTGTASRPASRAPARPPNAIATDVTICLAGPVCRPCRLVRPGICFSEGPLRAAGLVAEEPADRQHEQDFATADAGVGQPPHVAAVRPARLGSTARTRRTGTRC